MWKGSGRHNDGGGKEDQDDKEKNNSRPAFKAEVFLFVVVMFPSVKFTSVSQTLCGKSKEGNWGSS